jgi:futalosine hydrolase
MARLQDHGGFPPELARVELCGFGPIAAAARTAALLAALGPRDVLLVGIAGAYDIEAHPVGSAWNFGSVAVDGVGAGEGEGFLGPSRLGFPQWPGSPETTGAVHEQLELAPDGPLLLTTPSASATPLQASRRTQRFPGAAAEDMEGFAVALACAMAQVPVQIVRGISNPVGLRDPKEWRIPAALGEARRTALELLEELAS